MQTSFNKCISEVNNSTDTCFSQSLIYTVNERKGVQIINSGDDKLFCVRGAFESTIESSIAPSNISTNDLRELNRAFRIQFNRTNASRNNQKRPVVDDDKVESRGYYIGESILDLEGNVFNFSYALKDGIECTDTVSTLSGLMAEDNIKIGTNKTLTCSVEVTEDNIKDICTIDYLRGLTLYSGLFEQQIFRKTTTSLSQVLRIESFDKNGLTSYFNYTDSTKTCQGVRNIVLLVYYYATNVEGTLQYKIIKAGYIVDPSSTEYKASNRMTFELAIKTVNVG